MYGITYYNGTTWRNADREFPTLRLACRYGNDNYLTYRAYKRA